MGSVSFFDVGINRSKNVNDSGRLTCAAGDMNLIHVLTYFPECCISEMSQQMSWPLQGIAKIGGNSLRTLSI